MEYHFNNTSAFPGVHFSLEFSSTNCKADLIHVKSRDTDHFYRIFLQEDNIITFSNKLEDGEFNISVSLSGKQTFCDGEKHRVEFNRYGAILSSKADGEKEYRHKEPGIRKVIFSKPDKVVIGGISETKFDGCIHKAIVLFYWKRDLKNISINLLAQYLKGDSRVRYADVFLGACPDKRQECTRSKNINYIKSGDGLIVSPRKKERERGLINQCTWFFSAPYNKRLRLTLLFYNLDALVPCFESEVVVYDGNSTDSDVIVRFCYTKSSAVVYTRGNHMVIDMVLPKNGFLDFIAKYEFLGHDEGPCPTNKTLNGLSGSITSPNFPQNYGSEHRCSWIIIVPQGYHVLLSFNRTDFQIHSCSVTCDCDFLEVREGKESGNLLGKYCGNRIPSPIYGSGHLLWIRFVSDKFSSNKGFRATFQAIEDLKGECPWNKTLTSHRGFIHSPRYVLDYPGNMECIWRIHVSINHKVVLAFLGPLHFGPNCTDILEVRDGLDNNSPLLSLHCTSTVVPANIVSSGAKLYLRFKSNTFTSEEKSETGFRATYYALPMKSGAIIFKMRISVMTLAVWCIAVFQTMKR